MKGIEELPLDELFEKHKRKPFQSNEALMTELQRRQTKAQIEAAEYAKKSVRWMFWSVMVLAAASVASFVLNLLTFLQSR